MVVYLDALFGVNFLMNYLLLVGAARLSAVQIRRGRLAAAAALGGLYAVGVYLPQLQWLQASGMKLVVAACMVLCAFGTGRGALRQLLLFGGLSFALGGALLMLTTAVGGGWLVRGGTIYYPISLKALLLTAAAAYGVVWLVFSRLAAHGGGEIVQVRLRLGDRSARVPALVDTGNSLRDPLTNRPVLVVNWQLAQQILPRSVQPLLSETAFSDPAQLLEQLHQAAPELQLRLIPYRAVGVAHAMLLAVRCDEIVIGKKQQPGALAAFSPTELSDGGAYAALTA